MLAIRGQHDEVRLAQILIEQIIVNQPRIETVFDISRPCIISVLYQKLVSFSCTQVEIKIPFSATGMIIGRGGENIGAMQSISNCKIEVDRGAADKGMSIL